MKRFQEKAGVRVDGATGVATAKTEMPAHLKRGAPSSAGSCGFALVCRVMVSKLFVRRLQKI